MTDVNVEQIKFENGIRKVKLSGHIGFDSLPDQSVNKSVKHGYIFNIMCIGETGIGKSTLMDSLFNTNFQSTPNRTRHNLPTDKLIANTYELQECNVKLKLTIVETVGYGDQINNEESVEAIANYIDTQFEAFMQDESAVKRSTYQDGRIHVCLYFITSHGLKSMDLICMKRLDSKVNLIPIIAKADTISKSELLKFKKKIRNELQSNGINIYQFPTDDESVVTVNTQMNSQMPFAVVGSTEFVRIRNKMVRAREYPWGTVEVENEAHCDFVKLREMLIRTNMEDLRQTTHDLHYELFRQKRLQQIFGLQHMDSGDDLVAQLQLCQINRSKLKEIRQREDEIKKESDTRLKSLEVKYEETEKKLRALLCQKFKKSGLHNIEQKEEPINNDNKIEHQVKKINRINASYLR